MEDGERVVCHRLFSVNHCCFESMHIRLNTKSCFTGLRLIAVNGSHCATADEQVGSGEEVLTNLKRLKLLLYRSEPGGENRRIAVES